MSRIGAFGGTSLASGTESLLNDRRISGGSAPVAAIASRLRGVSRYPADSWTPYELFASGVSGSWYDPNDFRTMFQDFTAGEPVTGPGQPVAIIVDKARLNSRGVVNIFPFSENMSTFGTARVTVVGTDTIIENTENNTHFLFRSTVTAPSAVLRFDAMPFGRNWLRVSVRNASGTAVNAYFDVANGALGTIPAGYNASITPMSDGSYKCILIGPHRQTALNTMAFGPAPADNVSSYLGDGVSGIKILRAQYEVGREPTEYQFTNGNLGGGGPYLYQGTAASRPTLQQDQSTGAYYLLFDGVDDWMLTLENFTMSSTDEASLFVGARKQSDAGAGILFEYGSSGAQQGTVNIVSPGFTPATNFYQMTSRGSVTVTTSATDLKYAAPHSAVFSLVSDISADRLIGRINGSPDLSSNSDQGLASRTNYPVYMGRRGSSGLNYYNGRMYGAIFTNAVSNAETIALAEQWMASRVGVSVL